MIFSIFDLRCLTKSVILRFENPGPAPRGAFRDRAPSNDCLCPPKRNLCPTKRGLCPEEINRLGATGVQIEVKDSQIAAYFPRIREQELCFHSFCGLTPDFMKLWSRKPFFFGLHFRIREKLQKF